MARGFRNKIQKLQGRGELQAVTSEGPFIEWVGKPEYFRHTLTIEGSEYRYESDSTDLGVSIGLQDLSKPNSYGPVVRRR